MSEIENIVEGADLERFLVLAEERPVWFFKHSLTCGTSSWALERFRDFVESRSGDERSRYAVIPVQTARGVSKALVSATGVRHESPQVLLLHEGRVVWHASHWRITVEALEDAGRKATADGEGVAGIEA